MDSSFLNKLKDWRKSKKLSQKKLADAAGLSLTTVRLLEMGKQKAQGKTLEKIADAIRQINAGVIPETEPVEIVTPPRKKAKIEAKPEAVAEPKPEAVAEPKPEAVAEPKPETKPLLVKVREESSPIRLSNLDLELIRRILNMTEREKLNILQSLID